MGQATEFFQNFFLARETVLWEDLPARAIRCARSSEIIFDCDLRFLIEYTEMNYEARSWRSAPKAVWGQERPDVPPCPAGNGTVSDRSVGKDSTQVIDISSKKPKSCVVSRLIYRRLGRKPRVFDPFIACKGVDFPPVTRILPDFFAGGGCNHHKVED
jgi:hypothetical protein